MTPNPEQIAAAVERLKWARQRHLEIDVGMPQDLQDAGLLIEALEAAQADTRLLDWMEACPKDAYFDFERPIGEVSLKLFSKEDPVVFTAATVRAAISAAAGGEG